MAEEEIRIVPPKKRGRPPKVETNVEEVEKELTPKPTPEEEKILEEMKTEVIKAQQKIEEKTNEIMNLEKAKGVPDDLRVCISKIQKYKRILEKLNEEFIPQNTQKYLVKLEYKRLLKVEKNKKQELILKYGRSRAMIE